MDSCTEQIAGGLAKGFVVGGAIGAIAGVIMGKNNEAVTQMALTCGAVLGIASAVLVAVKC